MRKSAKSNNHRFRRLREQLAAETQLKLTVIYTISGKTVTGFAINAWEPFFISYRIKKVAVWKTKFVSEHLNPDQSQLTKCFALIAWFTCCDLGDPS